MCGEVPDIGLELRDLAILSGIEKYEEQVSKLIGGPDGPTAGDWNCSLWKRVGYPLVFVTDFTRGRCDADNSF
jgi:hypothetical protein